MANITNERDREPLAALVRQLAEQTSALARQEVRLAQLELRDKAKAAGVGAGFLGAAAVLGWFGLAAVLSAVGAAISLVVPVWAAALAVAGLGFMLAGVAAALGRQGMRKASPPAPRETAESVREDVATIRENARR
jgi:predicted phage tail protein